jgi:hypothetical protein
VPFPWLVRGKYESIEYGTDHLGDLDRSVKDAGGAKRRVIFRFSHHCFTDSRKANDFREEYIDPAFTGEDRVFCPKRWLLSRDLVKLLDGDLSKITVVSTSGDQYVWNHDVVGISKPYCVFFQFGVSMVGYPLVINVKSAYVKGGGKIVGDSDRFVAVLKKICGADGSLAA